MYNANGSVNIEWMWLDWIVSSLGADGVSTDESADEEGTMGNPGKVCHIREKPWRSPELIKYLKFVDRDRRITNAYGNVHAGNQPRRRIRGGGRRSEIRHIPPGLPINFYNAAWLRSLSAYDKSKLAPGAPVKLPEFEYDED